MYTTGGHQRLRGGSVRQSGLGFIPITDAVSVITAVTSLLGAKRNAKQKSMKRDQSMLTASMFGGLAPNMPDDMGILGPVKARAKYGERYDIAFKAYQRALLPWFQYVLENASRPDTVRKAETFLMGAGIDPFDYYKALALQLGVSGSEIAPRSHIATLVNNAPANATVAQTAQEAVLMKAATVAPAPPPIIPGGQSQVYTAPPPPAPVPYTPEPAPAPAPDASAPETPAKFNWEKWAVPLAMVAAALISSQKPRAGYASEDESGSYE